MTVSDPYPKNYNRESVFDKYLENIRKSIQKASQIAFSKDEIGLELIELNTPPDPEMGDFAFPCFPLARVLKSSPDKIAKTLEKNLEGSTEFQKIQAMGPYLNFRVNYPTFAQMVCEEIMSSKERFGECGLGKDQRVMVEYSSPNTNKPLHLGHVRNNLLGMALSNLLERAGFEVIRANLINDRGIHISKSMLAYQKWGEGNTPEKSEKKGDVLVGEFYVMFDSALKAEKESFAKERGVDITRFTKDYKKSAQSNEDIGSIEKEEKEFEAEFLAKSKLYQEAMELLRKWEMGDPDVRKIWATMREWVMDGFRQTYKTLGCTFDKFYYESETYTLGKEQVEKGVSKGVFIRKDDGSIWVEAEKLKQIAPDTFKNLPLKDKVLLRSDGTSVYITQDIGTAIYKCESQRLDRSLYVVASEQNLHFKTLFAILKLLGFPWADGCKHISYGMVTLPHGRGKLKSREGTAVDADTLIQEMTDRAIEVIRQGDKVRVEEENIYDTALKVALAALKVFILQVSEDKDIQFDPEKTIQFTGDTGPAVQYSYARICGILRKAVERFGWEHIDHNINFALLDSPEEHTLIRALFDYPGIIKDAASRYSVCLIPNYLLNLTKIFARFYHSHPVLDAPNEDLIRARLFLCSAVAQVVKNGLNIIGVDALERM